MVRLEREDNLRINWKKFSFLFVLCFAVLSLSGCGNWVGAIQALMPAIQAAIAAIFSFIGALEGKTIPQSVQDFVKKVEDDINAVLAEVATILSTISANAAQPVLQQIENDLSSVVSSLNTLLPGLGVTDSATIAKITSLVQLGVAAIESVLALIPLAKSPATAALTTGEQAHADKAATKVITVTHKELQSEYHTAVSTPTGEADVDAALAALPQTLP